MGRPGGAARVVLGLGRVRDGQWHPEAAGRMRARQYAAHGSRSQLWCASGMRVFRVQHDGERVARRARGLPYHVHEGASRGADAPAWERVVAPVGSGAGATAARRRVCILL